MRLYNLRLFDDNITRIEEDGTEKVLTKKYAKRLQVKRSRKRK